MKRIIILSIALLFAFTHSISATYTAGSTIYGKTSEGVEMKFNVIDPNAKTCKVGSWCIDSNTRGEITIPSSVEGFKVIEISDYSFRNCKNITSVNIPYSITTIGNRAFAYCESLSSITIPSNVTSLGEGAFDGCKFLKTFSGGDGLTEFGKWAFYQCESLVSFDIPSNIKVIGFFAFKECKKLETLTGGRNLEEIGESAFGNCESLKSINLPTNVKFIRRYAFSSCKQLETVKGGNILEEIGESAFYGCESLKSVNLNVKSIGKLAFDRCEKLESFTVEQGLEEIGYSAFNGCESLRTVSLPNTVKTIGNGAFSSCKELTTFTGIANVESITSSAFNTQSPWYKSLPDGLIYIGKVAYSYKNTSSMPENVTIDIKEGTTCITSGAFNNCSRMAALTIPQSVRIIGGPISTYCSNLSSIIIADGNKAYDSRNNCNAIVHKASNTLISGCKETIIPNSIKTIGDRAFSGCTFTSVIIPDGVDSLAYYVFQDCDHLKEVTIGKGLRAIGSYPFSDCSQLEDIIVSSSNPYFDSRNNCNGIVEKSTNTLVVGCRTTIIPSTVKNIGPNAFSACHDYFYTYTIPNQVNKIGIYAFNGNYKLRSVTIGSGINEIEQLAFSYCTSLIAIHSLIESPFEINENVFQHNWDTKDSIYNHATLYVPIGTRVNYMSTPGWNKFKHIVETDGKSLCDGEVFTEESIEGHLLTFQVTSASSKTCELIAAANNASGKITIPDSPKGFSVTSIAEKAFYDYDLNRDITSIIIPNSVTTIGKQAFEYCKKLESINIPDGVKTIEDDTFYMCEELTIPELPSSLEIIKDWAFSWCKGGTIQIPASVTTIGDYAFQACHDLTITSLPESLKTIGKYAFGSCQGVSLTIPASVIEIGKGAFRGWKNLTSISVDSKNAVYSSPSGSNAIIENSSKTLIAGCKNTVIPNTVECIGKNAFDNHSGLTEITIPNSVTVIDSLAFRYTGFTNIVIPASVRSIAYQAFAYCDNIKTITSQSKTPVGIPDDVFFNDRENVIDPYIAATLYVPEGTKALYQATDGWSLFQNIIEGTNPEQAPQEEEISKDGVTYLLDKDAKTATVKTIFAENTDLTITASIIYNGDSYAVSTLGDAIFNNGITDYYICSVSFPSSIQKVSEKAFNSYGPSAIIWNSSTKIPSNAFTGDEYKNRNFLLYVKQSGIAPSGVENVVVNGSADNITLNDNWQFNCPQEFTAKKISYTHNYKMETGIGESAGWETIALPFDVETIKHESKGELVPFASYQNGKNKKPFWLYYLSNNGFAEATSIKANTPYIISMPYNTAYSSNFNIGGKVTFSAANTKVYRTDETFLNTSSYDGGTFIPSYNFYPNSYDIYTLNVSNDNTTYAGIEKPGSIFLNNYRKIYPFEGRIEKSSTRSGSFDIVFANGDEATGIIELLQKEGYEDKQIRVYNLSGQLVDVINGDKSSVTAKKLPAGVYIINGKKVVVQPK